MAELTKEKARHRPRGGIVGGGFAGIHAARGVAGLGFRNRAAVLFE